MIILAKPAFVNRKKDPGNFRLYSELINQGVTILEWSLKHLVLSKFDILHIHWPDNILKTRSLTIASAKLFTLTLALFWVRIIRQKPVVWTSHNIISHELNFPRLESLFWRVLSKFLDGIIVHEDATKDRLLCLRPYFSRCLIEKIPLAHFRGAFPNTVTKSEARCELQLDENSMVFGFLGQIRPYKNVPALIEAFDNAPSDWQLVIAGNPHNSELKERLNTLARDNKNIHLKLEFVRDDDLQVYYNAFDLVVLPFEQITNSGSALLALSFDCPVLIADSPTLRSLEYEFGGSHVIFFEPPLSFEDLTRAGDKVKNHKSKPPNMSHRAPSVVASKTRLYYQSLLSLGDSK